MNEDHFIKNLRRKLNKLYHADLQLIIESSSNEENTKMNLISPFLNMLGFIPVVNLAHEYPVKIGNNNGKVDVAVVLENKPRIFIECKEVNNPLLLDEKRGRNAVIQLNKYCGTSSDVKIGILTNGIVYKFYKDNNKKWVNEKPFFEFNIREYNDDDIRILSLLSIERLAFSEMLRYANKKYFEESFYDGFVDLMKNPTHAFYREIYSKMGGYQTNDNVKKEMSKLLNVYSLDTICDRLHLLKAKDRNQYIFTTEKEKTFFNIVQGFFAVTSKINKKDLVRIGYRDFKTMFSIIVDNTQQKKVCYITENKFSYTLHVQKSKFNLKDINILSLEKYKEQIIDSAYQVLLE
jgi:predicted type IV restriction endonuclease